MPKIRETAQKKSMKMQIHEESGNKKRLRKSEKKPRKNLNLKGLMGIILAVKKKGVICIAADTLTISGGTRKQTAQHVINTDKIISCGSSFIGSASDPIWPLVFDSYFSKMKRKPLFRNREEIFRELTLLHNKLKENYHLTSNNDDDEPFESSKFESIIINSYGIFKTYELRSIQQFNHYTAIGTGAPYALGALFALYDRLDTAEEIAKASLQAAVEFDDSSGLPGTYYSVRTR